MDPRTLEQLIAITRSERLEDTNFPPRWSDAMLARALSEGEREAARTAKLILDQTSRHTLFPLVEGQADYLLHPAFFELDQLRYEDTGEHLIQVREDVLQRQDPAWRTRTASRPHYFVVQARNDERVAIRLTHIPTDIDPTLQLRVRGYRAPLYELSAGSDEPEIAPHYHESLIEWACYRAYQVRHPDQYDPIKSADHLAEFRRVFGPAIDANQRRSQAENRSHVIVARDV